MRVLHFSVFILYIIIYNYICIIITHTVYEYNIYNIYICIYLFISHISLTSRIVLLLAVFHTSAIPVIFMFLVNYILLNLFLSPVGLVCLYVEKYIWRVQILSTISWERVKNYWTAVWWNCWTQISYVSNPQ